MLKTKSAVITDVGIDMQLRNLNGKTIEFTKLVVGDGVYSESESDPELLRKMVSLKSPKQQFGVSSISMVDNEKIVASTVITNYELEEGYTIRELGLYARIKDDPESEGLVSLSLAEIEDTFPAYDGKVVSRIISRFQFSVSDSDTVQLSYLHDPVALVEDVDAKIAVLQKAIDDATALRASLEAYGMVKLCDSSAVTDSTGLALPATEKNASIEGTLAAQIASLNTDYTRRVASSYSVNSNWKDSPIGFSIFHYDNVNTGEYDIPSSYCTIFIFKHDPLRGVAWSINWNIYDDKKLWINSLCDTWSGWLEK
ncbi:MAG: phage tail protein [Agathobacter sp.]|nr:phage tail protein [Agathobacter sp.]